MPILISLVAIISSWYFAVKAPRYSLALIILFLPTFLFRWHIGNISFNTLDVVIFGSFALFAITYKNELKTLLSKEKIPLILLSFFIATAWTSAFFSPDLIKALGILKSYFILPALFTLMLLSVVKNKDDLIPILSSSALLSVFVSGVAFLQLFFPNGITAGSETWFAIPKPIWRSLETFRVTSFLEYPNAIGLLLSPLIPLFIALYNLTKQRSLKILSLIAVFASIISVYLAKSKGALLALILAAVVWCFMRYKKQTLIATIIIGIFVILFPPSLSPLISKIGPGSYSAQLRTTQWKETIELLKDSPIIGAGLAGFQERVTPYHTREYIEVFLYPHNIILNFWVELGFFGLLVFISLIIFSIYKSISLIRRYEMESDAGRLALLGLLSMLIILIHGIVDVPYFKNDLAVVFFLVWSWPILLKQIFLEYKV